MQHNRIQNYRVGDWRNSPLKYNGACLQKSRAVISNCPAHHFPSAGLFLVAHLPQQATSASTQQKQNSSPFPIFTTCLISRPLTE